MTSGHVAAAAAGEGMGTLDHAPGGVKAYAVPIVLLVPACLPACLPAFISLLSPRCPLSLSYNFSAALPLGARAHGFPA